MSETDKTMPETTDPVVSPPSPKARRPKSQLRLQLEALKDGETIRVNYDHKRKTPFSVMIAIKRLQLKRHFVYKEVSDGVYDLWVGRSEERSKSLTSAQAPA